MKELQAVKENLLTALKEDFPTIEINPILSNWYLLSWEDFLHQLEIQNVNPLNERNRNWEYFFITEKSRFHFWECQQSNNSSLNYDCINKIQVL